MAILGTHIVLYFIIPGIAILTFFGVRWVVRKFVKSNILLRHVLTWVGSVIFTLLFCALFFVLALSYESYYPSRAFNEALWHTDAEKRYELTEDLIDRKLLIGKTKEKVRNILGSGLYNRYTEDLWVYDVGTRPGGFLREPDFLNIYFKDEKVERVEQRNK